MGEQCAMESMPIDQSEGALGLSSLIDSGLWVHLGQMIKYVVFLLLCYDNSR